MDQNAEKNVGAYRPYEHVVKRPTLLSCFPYSRLTSFNTGNDDYLGPLEVKIKLLRSLFDFLCRSFASQHNQLLGIGQAF
jgi:hypothetical protein